MLFCVALAPSTARKPELSAYPADAYAVVVPVHGRVTDAKDGDINPWRRDWHGSDKTILTRDAHVAVLVILRERDSYRADAWVPAKQSPLQELNLDT